MFLNDVRYMRVFNKEVSEKFVRCNLSEGEKQQDGTYKNYSWRTTFVGGCLDKAKALNDKDVITITKGKVTNEYVKEQGKAYVNVVVFDFDKQESNTSGNDGFYPINESMDDDDLPF